MANTSSAKKKTRQIVTRTERNKTRISGMRTAIRKVVSAIEAKDQKNANDAFRVAQPLIHRSVTKGILKKNTAARTLSRLSAKIKAIA